jgi:hypothetical protein
LTRIGRSLGQRRWALGRADPAAPCSRRCREEKFDIQLDEEGAEKISTVQEAADLIAAQIDK